MMDLAIQLQRIQAALQAATDLAAQHITEPGDDAATAVVDEGYTALAEIQELLGKLPNPSFIASVAKAYVARRECHEGESGWKKGTLTDQKRQLEFFLGAASAADHYGYQALAAWIAVTIASGRDCSEFLPD